MTDPTPAADIDRIPLAHSVRYVARGLPDLPFQYGRGVIRPAEIVLTYRSAPDSQLGRVHAYVTGHLWVDGHEASMGEGYGQHYDDGMPNWPAWLTEEARLHDPDAATAPASRPTDRSATRERIVATIERLYNEGAVYALEPGQANLMADTLVGELLPAPADQAAILREVADALPEADLPFVPPMDRRRVANWLRRLADAASGPGRADDQPQQDAPVPAAFAPGMPCEHGCRAAADELARETQQDETRKPCTCRHPADEHSVYGCSEDCGCEWMPKRRPAKAQQPECACDPAPHREDDGTYSHWAGCPIADAQQAAGQTQQDETRRCVCGDPIEWMDHPDGSGWIHSPGSNTPCLDAREARQDEGATADRDATLGAMLEGFGRLLDTSSRDWGEYRVDAWLYAVICGWDCEETVHNETCVHGAMEEMQARHGWSDEAVAKARRYRALVRALTEPAAVSQPGKEA